MRMLELGSITRETRDQAAFGTVSDGSSNKVATCYDSAGKNPATVLCSPTKASIITCYDDQAEVVTFSSSLCRNP